MRKSRFVVVFILIFSVIWISPYWEFPEKSFGVEVSGLVWDTWTVSKSPYYLTGNVTIPFNKTLVIEPGVEVIANASFHIFVGGTLYANGTESAPIYFTGRNFTSSDYAWEGIHFNSTGTGMLKNCSITNATIGLTLNNTQNLVVQDTELSANYLAINGENLSTNNSFIRCYIYYNLYGFYLENVINSYIYDSEIWSNVYWGIIYENSQNNIINTTAINYNGMGICYRSYSSNNLINNSQIISNTYAGFGLGLEFLYNSRNSSILNSYINNNNVEITNINSSNLFIDNCIIHSEINIKNSCKITINDSWIYLPITLNSVSDVEINECYINTETTAIKVIGDSENIRILENQITYNGIGIHDDWAGDEKIPTIFPSEYINGIDIKSSENILMRNNTIRYFDIGIYLIDCNNTQIETSQIFYSNLYGMFSYSCSNIQIDYCGFSNNNYMGLYLDHFTSHFQVRNSIMSDNGNYGCFQNGYCDNITFFNCNFYENQDGLGMSSGNDVNIYQCKFQYNSNNGLSLIEGDKFSVYNSEINYNDYYGIETNAAELYLENCSVLDNNYRTIAIYSNSVVYFINSTYNSAISFESDYGVAYVGWFLDIEIKTTDGTPVPNADVRLVSETEDVIVIPFDSDSSASDLINLTEQHLITDSTGMVRQIICYQKIVKAYDTFEYNPYRIYAHKPGIGAATKTLHISQSTKISLVLENYDLILSKIKIDKPTNKVPTEEFFNLTAEIKNTGNQPVEKVALYYQIEGNEYNFSDTFIIPSIPAQSTMNVSLGVLYIMIETGVYSVKAIIDYHDIIYETNEKNNENNFEFIIIERPKAVLIVNRSIVYVGDNITFDASQSSGRVAILEYIFDFGDGSIQREKDNNIVEHNYTTTGTYEVRLYVIDIDGISSGTVSSLIEVNDRPEQRKPPEAFFTITPTTGDIRTIFRFKSYSTPSTDAKITSYLWDFGDNKTSTILGPSHIYSDDRTYEVRLIIEDSADQQAEYKLKLTVVNVEPSIDLVVENENLTVGEAVIFNASQTTDLDDTLTEPLTRFIWSFGDGSNYTESPIRYPDGKFDKNTKHLYTNPGKYEVTLIVYDDDGAINQTSIEITVNEAFDNVKTDDGGSQKTYLGLMVGAFIIFLIILLMIFLLIRRRRRTRQAQDSKAKLADELYGTSGQYSDYLDTEPSSAGVGPAGGAGEKPSAGGPGAAPAHVQVGAMGKKPKKSKRKRVGAFSRTGSVRPVEVEVELPEEKVINWQSDKAETSEDRLSLDDVDLVTNGDLSQASIIGIGEDEFVEYQPVEELGAAEELEEPEEAELEDVELIFEPDTEETWLPEPDELEEGYEEEFEELPEEEGDTTEPLKDTLVFEFEDDGITRSTEFQTEQKLKPKPKKKDDLIAIPGIGFVTRDELKRAIGEHDEGFEPEDYSAYDIPLPDGVPLKVDESFFPEQELRCKWCNKPIKGKYIKVRRKQDDDVKFGIVGPFCSPECAKKFGY